MSDIKMGLLGFAIASLLGNVDSIPLFTVLFVSATAIVFAYLLYTTPTDKNSIQP